MLQDKVPKITTCNIKPIIIQDEYIKYPLKKRHIPLYWISTIGSNHSFIANSFPIKCPKCLIVDEKIPPAIIVDIHTPATPVTVLHLTANKSKHR